jgi:hypothetical protein
MKMKIENTWKVQYEKTLCSVMWNGSNGTKIKRIIKRHFEFRSLLQKHFSTYRPNILHIVLNILTYEVLMITVFLNLTKCILIEICRRLRGTFCRGLQVVPKKETAGPSERRQLSSRLYAVRLRRR